MRFVTKIALGAAFLLSCRVFVQADTVTWTFSDVVFSDGNVVSGNFVTDTSLDVESFAITVAGAGDVFSFTANTATDSFDQPALFSSEVGFASDAFAPADGFDPFALLFVDGPILGSGGTYDISGGLICKNGAGGCLSLDTDGHSPELNGTLNSTATPEPSTLPLLSITALVGAIAVARRKFARAS